MIVQLEGGSLASNLMDVKEHVHLLVFPGSAASAIDELLKAINRLFSFRIKPLLQTTGSSLSIRLDEPAAIWHWELSLLTRQNLGNARQQMGHSREAIEHLEHALRLAPFLVQAYAILAQALAAAGHTEKAVATAQQGPRKGDRHILLRGLRTTIAAMVPDQSPTVLG